MTVTAGASAGKKRASSKPASSYRCFTLGLVSAVALTAVVATILSSVVQDYNRAAAQQQKQQSTPRGPSRPLPRLETNDAESRLKGNAADEIATDILETSKRNHEQRASAGTGRYRERPDIVESDDHDPTSASYGQDSGAKMWADNSVEKDCPVAPGGDGDEVPTRTQTVDDEDSWNTAASSSKDSASWKAIPFFGSVDGNNNAQSSSTWSHLNHRVEEYREDLVKVVQSLDMIINTLESSAATKSSVGGQDRDMPGDGMRQLAAKLRRKLDKTPPRWQVNTDVLSWLLRPVPFVTGLPSPSPSAPFAPAGAPDNDDDTTTSSYSSSNRNINNNHIGDDDNAIGHERGDKSSDDFGVVDISAGDASGEGGEEEAVKGRKEDPAGDARSSGASAVKERRATPVPAFEGARAGEDVGSGGMGKQGSKKRSGFHAYDETHQMFTHILRDWTSEGDTVRAGVYDPLLRALDEYVGWQEYAVPLVDHPIGLNGRSSAGSNGETTSIEGGGRGDGDDVIGGKDRTQEHGALGGQTGLPSGPRFPSSSSEASCARRRKANVLVPGAGLGRLAAEVAARGYASVHANELSITMLSSSYWLMEALRDVDFTGAQPPPPAPGRPVDRRSRKDGDHPPLSPAPAARTMSERSGVGHARSPSQKCGDNGDSGDSGEARRFGPEVAKEKELGRGGDGGGRRADEDDAAAGRNFFKFYPFLNDPAHNEIDGEARFRSVLFPDPEGRAVLERASGSLSFQAGEFSATYGGVGGPYEGTFDAVVTSFFVDTAPNVVQYVATIRRALKPGGVWVNCGPLHWHDHSALALSLDEMLVLLAGSGFRMKEATQLAPSAYRVQDGAGSLRVEEFSPVLWVAVLEGGAQA